MLLLAKNCDFRTCSSLFVDNLCESCSHCRHAPRSGYLLLALQTRM